MEPDETSETDAFPGQFARTRRFSLGAPGRFTVSPDGARVLYLRTASGTDPYGVLWLHENGRERVLAGSPEHHEATVGVGAYAADRDVRLVAVVLDGALWTVRTDGGAPRRIPTAGPVTDPRPSPDGTLVAYVTGGTLRVVGADGSGDRPLAEPEADDVAYGAVDHVSGESIGRTRAYWWSPDSGALLVARVDTSMVEQRHIADPAHPERRPSSFRYPAAGTANAVTTLHLVGVDGEHTPVALPSAAGPEHPRGTWDAPAFEYLVDAAWGDTGPVVALQTRDQRTAWIMRLDPTTGRSTPLEKLTDPHWVEFPAGTPLLTASGTLVAPVVRGDTRAIRVGGVPSPDGAQVREVLGAVGERVYFTASEEPTEVHVWSYDTDAGFVRLTREPGVHRAAVGGGTVVLDSRLPSGHEVTLLRDDEPVARIPVLTPAPLVTPRPTLLRLGARELRARLHLPSWYEPGAGRLPVLLSPYAGPGLQVVTRARAWWTAVAQWFAEQGFAVLSTDGRGTPGRGVAWQRTIVGDRLTPVLDDQIDALHAAAERYDALDLGRVGIRGWSFSGYLAAGAVLRRPDVFHAAVAGAPPVDRRWYDTYWEERYLGHPGCQPAGDDAYERSSLLPGAAALARPLLLVHGSADDNVFPVHTLRLSAALLAAGRPHSVLPLPGVGHLVAREGVADALLRYELRFLKDALGVADRDG